MHIWPSVMVRESFKVAYLNRVEWNLRRMESEKKSLSTQRLLNDETGKQSPSTQKLLNDASPKQSPSAKSETDSKSHTGILASWRDILMLLSCCYCGFCCGACLEEEITDALF